MDSLTGWRRVEGSEVARYRLQSKTGVSLLKPPHFKRGNVYFEGKWSHSLDSSVFA